MTEAGKKTDRQRLIRRILVCAVGMFFYASGANITKNCAMGISPIISVAYALSLVTPLTMGWGSTVFNLPLLAIQRILLKEKFPWTMMAAQLVLSIVFTLFIDWTAVIWRFLTPSAYPLRLLQFLIGCFVLAFGVYLVVSADFVMLSGEGTVKAVCCRTGWKFGNVKIGFDGACVVLTALLTLIFLHGISGIREGTVIAVILIGSFTKLWAKWLKKPVDRILLRG